MKLTAKHLHLLELLADPLDMGTNKAKAKRAGLSEVAMYRMLKDKEAIRILNERTYELIPTVKPEAYRCLARELRKGNVQAAKAALQSFGDIGSGGHTTHVNVKQDNRGRDEETLEDAVRRISHERWDRVVPTNKD